MEPNKELPIDYSAKRRYRGESDVARYEELRFSGWLGRHRFSREQKAISALIMSLPANISMLDCPSGNGRWWKLLARRANRIIAIDLSPTMLKYSGQRIPSIDVEVEIYEAGVESLPLSDNSVDYSFCHALTKHLPIPVQYGVLMELARVSSRGVICSFGILSHLTYEFWRRRKLQESYPVFPEELQWMAEAAKLRIEAVRKCSTLIGVEHTVLFHTIQ